MTAMRRILNALGLAGTLACFVAVAPSPASAQPYEYEYGPPVYGAPAYHHHYRYRPRDDPPRYYGERGYYPPRAWGSADLRTPRFDPRNGGWYCLDRRFTVQDGVCKPYRGF
jgi:hypothetical protein